MSNNTFESLLIENQKLCLDLKGVMLKERKMSTRILTRNSKDLLVQ